MHWAREAAIACEELVEGLGVELGFRIVVLRIIVGRTPAWLGPRIGSRGSEGVRRVPVIRIGSMIMFSLNCVLPHLVVLVILRRHLVPRSAHLRHRQAITGLEARGFVPSAGVVALDAMSGASPVLGDFIRILSGTEIGRGVLIHLSRFASAPTTQLPVLACLWHGRLVRLVVVAVPHVLLALERMVEAAHVAVLRRVLVGVF